MNARRRLLKLLDEAMEGLTDATGFVQLCSDLLHAIHLLYQLVSCKSQHHASCAVLPLQHVLMHCSSIGCCWPACFSFCIISVLAQLLCASQCKPHALHS